MKQHSFTHTAYPLEAVAEGYVFITESSEKYLLYYTSAKEYFPGLKVGESALMFGFTRPDAKQEDEHKTVKDPRIKATVIKEIERFLNDDRNVLAYVCAQTPKRSAAARNQLFKK